MDGNWIYVSHGCRYSHFRFIIAMVHNAANVSCDDDHIYNRNDYLCSCTVILCFINRSILQAVGTGLLIPIIFNTFLLIFPPHRRGAVMGIIGLVIMFAPAIGPTLSGIIVEHLGWRYLFITVIPFALFSILFAYKYLVNVSELTKPKIDIISIIFSTIGFGGVVFGFSSAGGEEAGFLAPIAYMPII